MATTPRKTTAQKAEALETAVSFDYDGETYTIQPTAKWDLDVLEAYEDGRIMATCRALLGPDQWATFRSKPRDVEALTELFGGLQKAVGVSGN